jgi:hypothetical protein
VNRKQILKQGQSDIKKLKDILFPWLEKSGLQITPRPIVMQMNKNFKVNEVVSEVSWKMVALLGHVCVHSNQFHYLQYSHNHFISLA